MHFRSFSSFINIASTHISHPHRHRATHVLIFWSNMRTTHCMLVAAALVAGQSQKVMSSFCNQKFALVVGYHGNQMNNQMDCLFGALMICEATGRVCVLDGLEETAPSIKASLYSNGEDYWRKSHVKVPLSKYFNAASLRSTYRDSMMDSTDFLRRVSTECNSTMVNKEKSFTGHLHLWYKPWETKEAKSLVDAAASFNAAQVGPGGAKMIRVGDIRPTPGMW